MEEKSNSILAHRTTSAPFCAEMLSKPVDGPNESPAGEEGHHHGSIHRLSHSDDGGNQSDSSNSTSSLASSPRYNERHPRAFENFRKSSGGSNRSGGGNSSSTRGSFVVLGSRTSLPPLDENSPLDTTESQLSLKLRRATRSSSWTNQKILDAIDGLNTSIEDLDPCLVLGGKISASTALETNESCSKTESSGQSSLEKFTVPKSISNLIMKSRITEGNPPTSASASQNREEGCFNFLSGIREDEDEGEHQDDGTTGGLRLKVTSSSEEKRKHALILGVNNKQNQPQDKDKILGEKIIVTPQTDIFTDEQGKRERPKSAQKLELEQD